MTIIYRYIVITVVKISLLEDSAHEISADLCYIQMYYLKL